MLSRWHRVVALCALVGAGTFAAAWSWAQQTKKPTVDIAMNAPDPPAMRSADQYVLRFRYDKGKVSWVGSRRVHLPQPRITPRVTGRWALEMLSGPTLVERVRFDFPGLGADELAGQARPHNAPPAFERKVMVVHDVLIPDSPHFSRARLVDRATGKILNIPWPPVVASADAGAEAAAADRSAGDASVPDGQMSGDGGGATDSDARPD